MSTPSPCPPVTESLIDLPWKKGGLTSAGIDCRGLAILHAKQRHGLDFPEFDYISQDDQEADQVIDSALSLAHHAPPQEGEYVFLRHRPTGKVRHVVICVASGRYLHIMRGGRSCIVNGLTLFRRINLESAGTLGLDQAAALAAALAQRQLGDPVSIIVSIVVGAALSTAAALLMPKPKIGQFKAESGRYGFDNLFTRADTALPIPDVLGAVMQAGNSVFQSPLDRSQTISSGATQKANRVVIMAAGPIDSWENAGNEIRLNGLPMDSAQFHNSGFLEDPAQTYSAAVNVTRPNFTKYAGVHAIEVPVDIRAHHDRNMPVYGFAGCAYLVVRFYDSTKFPSFNLTASLRGRKCRTFTSSGFNVTTISSESLTGADGSKVRFKLANTDIKALTALTVNGTTYTEADATNQAGHVFTLNKTKGFIEFHTAPAASATISADYTYYPREWSDNNASHAVYLLTELIKGKGFPEAKINWERAVELQGRCDAEIVWNGAIEKRYRSNYSLDFRKPAQDHLRAILDACYAYLFVSQGQFVLKARHADESVFSFDTTNILVLKQGGKRSSTFQSEDIPRAERSNQIKVRYRDRTQFNVETGTLRNDKADQEAREAAGNEGIVSETLDLLAVDSLNQADRQGETILRENVHTRKLVTLKTNILGIALEPGDVVDVTHPSQPSWNAKLFRIEDITHDNEDRLQFKLSEYYAPAYI